MQACVRWLAAGLVMAWLCGCADSGPAMGKVEGTVTLDGVPLVDHLVEFTSVEQAISPSYGSTDKTGHYWVRFSVATDGAVIGKQRVRIYPNMDDYGMPISKVGPYAPPKYYKASELAFEVKKGRNTANFELTSK